VRTQPCCSRRRSARALLRVERLWKTPTAARRGAAEPDLTREDVTSYRRRRQFAAATREAEQRGVIYAIAPSPLDAADLGRHRCGLIT
jgi:hypothetical protein